MILCDTNILIEIYRKNADIISAVSFIAATAIFHNIELFTLNIRNGK
jgi:predicted nucleic acid-binding protein